MACCFSRSASGTHTASAPKRHGTSVIYTHLYGVEGAELDEAWRVLESEIRRSIVDIGFTCFRVGLYWSHIAGETGSAPYDFEIVDKLMNTLAKLKRETGKSLTVILTVGMKAPAWPEFYLPVAWETKAKADPHGGRGCDVSQVAGLADASLSFCKEALLHMTGLRHSKQSNKLLYFLPCRHSSRSSCCS